ncbi:MAG TPA: glycosyltransferase family 2 protein, partial [Alphaproteobacteria bacterium]|nr:glycosyltransferase family 2 protein [Alphaproteobacteria bacterium]
MKKVLISLLAYNAENHIISVLKRIPESFLNNPDLNVHILLLDDASSDRTAEIARQNQVIRKEQITIIKNEKNFGYGGNQKNGYNYAIENGFDAVILLHGDGQYAPEKIEDILSPILYAGADCVLGSRMVNRKDALKGGMPLYKFLGNIFLTSFQNFVLGLKLGEFHTGYRAYNVSALKQ